MHSVNASRDELLAAKSAEVQDMLETWAQANILLSSGEQIEFTLTIKKVSLVVQGNTIDYGNMTVTEFFSHDRLTKCNLTRGNVPRIANCIRNEFGCIGQTNITVAEFVDQWSVRKLLRIPNMGRKATEEIVRLLGEVGFKFS